MSTWLLLPETYLLGHVSYLVWQALLLLVLGEV
jgi:hypothetical protein